MTTPATPLDAEVDPGAGAGGPDVVASMPGTPDDGRGATVRGPLAVGLLVLAIAVFSLNLRPALVAVSPLLDELRADTGLSATSASLLTTVPLLCFGLFATVAPRLGRRFGIEAVLLGALVVVVAGTVLRLATPVGALVAGSAVVGAGIAIANVLLPGVIKRDFARSAGPVMGIYSMCLNGGAALAAGTTVPLQHALGLHWRSALALWGIMAVVAALLWLPQMRVEHHDIGGPARAGRRSPWRQRLAWQVSLFMGLQSLEYYALTAWLPTLFADHGMSAGHAGLMLSVLSIAGIPTAFVGPILATRARRQRHLVATAVGLFLVGLVGLLVAPVGGALVWMIAIGFGQGLGISLALTFFVLRTRDGRDAAELSGMAQTVGYLVAATGPFLAGALHDASGSWTAPLVLLVVLLGGLLATGFGAGRDRLLGDAA